MTEPSALLELLKEADVPWGHYSGGKGQRIVYVHDLLGLARSYGITTDEAELDALVREVGGHREDQIVDLGDVPRNLWARLRRNPGSHAPASYVFPPFAG